MILFSLIANMLIFKFLNFLKVLILIEDLSGLSRNQ